MGASFVFLNLKGVVRVPGGEYVVCRPPCGGSLVVVVLVHRWFVSSMADLEIGTVTVLSYSI